jgi:hypothetical protein
MPDSMRVRGCTGDNELYQNSLHPDFAADEAAEIRAQRLHRGAKTDEPTVGLAISGGGIRSATFGLGVMQALREKGVLDKVDYLSTVSGGGYVGSWLTANCARNGGWDWIRKAEWGQSIRHLRKYSNYLAPQLGFFSADTWSIGTIWIRNLMLIQITIVLGLFALMLIPWMAEPLFTSWHEAGDWRFLTFFLFGLGVVGAAGNLLQMQRPNLKLLNSRHWIISIFFGLTWITGSYLLYRREDWMQSPWMEVLCSALLLAGMFFMLPLAVKVYSGIQAFQGVKREDRAQTIRYGQTLTQWLLVVPMMIASYFIGAVMFEQSKTIFGGLSFSALLAEAFGHWVLPYSFAGFTFLMLALCSRRASAKAGIAIAFLSATVATVVLYPLLCVVIFCGTKLQLLHVGAAPWLAQILMPAAVLYVFSIGVVVLIGMMGKASTEGAREWWSRMGAWLGIYGFAWTALSAFSLLSPFAAISLGTISVGGLGGIIATTASGLFAGNSADTKEGKSGWKELLAKLAPFLFLFGLLTGTATALYFLAVAIAGNNWSSISELHAGYWAQLKGISTSIYLYALFAASLLASALFASRVDLNEFSMNSFYRSRLTRCYLGAARWKDRETRQHPFTGFDTEDDIHLNRLHSESEIPYWGPLHIVNCALNLGGAGDLALQSRQATNFQFSALHCGSSHHSVQIADTASYSGPEGPTLGQVVSVSGAAASPNMGYHSSPPVAFLLTMFNVRLGWWFGNPSRKRKGDTSPAFSLRYLAVELLASATPDSNYLMISDGGHFENLAAYELVRRKTRIILCSDAEADPTYGFDGLGRLIRICAVDFGAQIDIDLSSVRPDPATGRSRSHCAIGRITYVDGTKGILVYMKASWKGNEAEAVKQYRSAYPAFPHESTGDQFYSEEQFESYRTLGHEVGLEAFERFSGKDLHHFVNHTLPAILSPELNSESAFTRHTARLSSLYARLGSDPQLQNIASQFMDGLDTTPAMKLNLPQQYFCMEVLQLMEDVFVDLQLDDNFEHPDTKGWLSTFEKWVQSPALAQVRAENGHSFGVRFASFWDRLAEAPKAESAKSSGTS